MAYPSLTLPLRLFKLSPDYNTWGPVRRGIGECQHLVHSLGRATSHSDLFTDYFPFRIAGIPSNVQAIFDYILSLDETK
jgi:hypothetical protein